jgi:hypothetical protein
MLDYLTHTGVSAIDKSSLASFRLYDYTSARVKLIASVPGYHSGKDLEKYGHMRLRKELSKEKIPAKFDKSDVLCQVRVLYRIVLEIQQIKKRQGSLRKPLAHLDLLNFQYKLIY